MSKHLNIYGPKASGKTRNAQAFAKLFGCRRIVEFEPHLISSASLAEYLDDSAKTLFLSIDPVCRPGDHRVKTMHIKDALKRLYQGKS